ncbi:hypothetical protein PFICI_00788 [Pestalotiopsis fici W106-1]|uniref:Ankyrin n=1 Tax=Pestalotiopsis fici (strain W106-1 / CGMCC3.15140) TaxID=1229662 RepID=W3XLV4_PESFW|nr:uncharacterized protein PFICI_00788 [Pestalotiopsis fici W106-1]ETS86960.1 hypothetical protein PFICI_00788 [Pestalotiopsis fici W106-1]
MDSMVRALALCSDDLESEEDVNLSIATALGQPLNREATINQTLPQVLGDAPESVQFSMLEPRCITATQIFKTLLFQISNRRYDVEHPLLAQHMMKLIYGLCREAPAAVDHLLRSPDLTSAAIKETFFAIAVTFGQSLLVSKFLAAGKNPNLPMSYGMQFDICLCRGRANFVREQNTVWQVTRLQLASSACDVQMATVLLEYGARPDLGNPTPLQIVCSRSPGPHTMKLAKLLLRYGAQLDTAQHNILLPPLLEAVACQNKEMVHLLITEGSTDKIVSVDNFDDFKYSMLIFPSILPVNVHSPTYWGPFPMHHYSGRVRLYKRYHTISAMQIGVIINDADILDILNLSILHHGSRKEIYRHTFITACLAADEGMIHKLLNMDIEILDDDTWVNSAFCALAWISDCRIARLLLHNGLVPRWSQRAFVSPVQVAALHGNAELIELLHSYECDVNRCPNRELVTVFPGPFYMDILMGHWRPLDCAIRFRHSQSALVLLRLGAWLSDTTLSLAIRFGNDELVINLLSRDASIAHGSGERSLILTAIEQRRGLICISRLFQAGAGIGRDELVEAVRQNQQDVSEYLLASGANILAPGTNGTTVLETAAQAGNFRLIQRYINSGGHYNSKALQRAVYKYQGTSDHCMVQYLFQCRPPGALDAAEVSMFVQSILTKDHILVEMFLDLRPELFWYESWPSGPQVLSCGRIRLQDFERVDKRWVSPLWAAAYMQQEQLVNELILRKHPPDHFLLESALFNQDFASKEMRQRLGTAYPLASIKDEELGHKLLMSAIRLHAEPELFQQQIVSLNSFDFVYGEYVDDSRTPLQLAVEFGKLGCAKVILESGSNINAPASGVSGMTALQATVYVKNIEMATLLLDSGADVNASASVSHGHTALQFAVRSSNLEMVILLLEHGADVNGLPSMQFGMTAIEIAARRGLIDISALLLQHLNVEGALRIHFVRAVRFAEDQCYSAIVALLKKHGGWTEEDRRLAASPKATIGDHTCPRFLYGDESWNGECPQCKFTGSSDSSSAPNSSGDDDSINLQFSDSNGIEEQEMQSGMHLLDDDFTVLQYPLEESILGDTEVTPTIFAPYDSTDRWLDDLARDYIDSLV